MLEVTRIGDAYHVTGEGVALVFEHLHDSSSSGLQAEVWATQMATGHRHWSRLSLAAPRSRADLAKALAVACPAPGVDWGQILDTACAAVVRMYRAGHPSVPLHPAAPPAARWLVPGLMPLGETSVLFGDGGSMKSLFALALAVACLRGAPMVAGAPLWQVPQLGPVLYLDWESNQAALQARLWGLCEGLGVGDIEGLLMYRPMERSLADSLPAVQRDVAQHGVGLVIVDSLAPASGTDPETADAATRAFNALRTLPATRLVLAHVSKVMADSTAPSRPFGSVFVQNLARSTIEVRVDEATGGGDPLGVTYYHRKANDAPLAPPRALLYDFTPSGRILLGVAPADLSRGSISAQIIDNLRAGAMTAPALADVLGVPANQVRPLLARLEKRNIVVRLSVTAPGRGNKTLWGLLDEKRNSEA